MKSERWQKSFLNHFLILFFVLLNTSFAFAGPTRTTYQAKIVKPDGYPLEASNVNFKFTLLDPSGSCAIYAETYSSVNMTNTAGLISFSLGSGVKTYPVSATTFEQVFSNITPNLACDTGGRAPAVYTPLANDARKILMQFHDGNGWQTLPAMNINAVPYAMYANDSQKFNGMIPSEFVQVSTLPTCTASQALRFTGAGFQCVAAGGSGAVTSGSVVTAFGYTPADSAELVSVSSNVASVSSTVFSVSSTVTSLSSSVSALSTTVSSLSSAVTALSNSFSTFQSSVTVSFSAVVNSQWSTSGTTLTYNAGGIFVSGGVRVGAENNSCSTALAGTLRYNSGVVEYCNGTSWVAFGVSGAGIMALNGLASGSQTFAFGATGNSPNVSSVGTVHTFNFPYASVATTTAGLISYSDFLNFANKQNALGYVPADAVSFTTLVSSVETSFTSVSSNISNVATSITALSANLATVSASANSAQNNIAAVSSVVTSLSNATAASFTSLVLSKITSSAASIAQVLGYTPANAVSVTTLASNVAAITSSQWTTSGSTINYLGGNVGIGTSDPTSKLYVAGAGQVVTTIESESDSNGSILRLMRRRTTGGALINDDYVGGMKFQGMTSAGTFAVTGAVESSVDDTPTSTKNPGRLVFSTTNPAGTTLERMRIDSSGNVGIGITSASAKLQIAAGGATIAPLKFTSGTLLSSPQSGSVEYDGFNFYLTDGANTRRSIATGSSAGSIDNASYINSTGNMTLTPTGSVIVSSTTASTNSSTGALVVKGGLGVAGTTNLAGPLNVSSTINASSYMSAKSLFYLGSTNSTYANGVDAYAGGERGFVADMGGNTAWNLLDLKNASGTRFIVDGGGYTGIGTDIPDRRLTIIGDGTTYGDDVFIEATNSESLSAFPQINLVKSRGTVAVSRTQILMGDTLGAIAFRGYNGSTHSYGSNIYSKAETSFATTVNGDLRFQTASGGTLSDRMVINSAGNVGFGLTNPSAALHVEKISDASVSGLQNLAVLINQRNVANTELVGEATGIGFSRASTGSAQLGGKLLFISDGTGFGRGDFSFNLKAAAANGDIPSEVMRMKANGLIGIGTSAPTTALHISTSGTSQRGLRIAATASGSNVFAEAQFATDAREWRMGVGGTSETLYGVAGKYYLYDLQANAMRMSLDANGNMGLGTTSATSRFTVSRPTASGSQIEINNNAYNGFLTAPGSNNGIIMSSSRYNGNWIANATGAGAVTVGEGVIQFYTNSGLTVSSPFTYNERMRVDSSGDVMIGTTTPGGRLSVEASGAAYVSVNTTNATHKRAGILLRSNYATQYEIGVDHGTTGLRDFYIWDAVSGTHRLNINSVGNVGIGTLTPKTPLDVNGIISTTWGTAFNTSFDGAWKQTTTGYAGLLQFEAATGKMYFWNTPGSAAAGAANPFPVQSMTIDKNGYVGIGNASPGAKFHVNGDARINAIVGGEINGSGNFHLDAWSTGATRGVYLNWGSGTGGAYVGNGAANYGPIAASAFNVSSDRRLKENIKPIENPLEKILKIDAVTFTWKESNRNKQEGERIGLIAQNVEEVFPQAVRLDKGENSLPGGTKLVTYSDLVSPIIAAIQEFYSRWISDSKNLHEKIEMQKREISSLKDENADKEKQLKQIRDYLCAKNPSAPICQ